MKNTLVKAVYAGFMIGVGGVVYLALENKIVGALLFSFGLLTIVNQGFFLYTGKIGFAKTKEDFERIRGGSLPSGRNEYLFRGHL